MPTPSLILVPARFKTGKLYTPVATTSGGVVLGASGDFNVTRNTTATRVNANGLIESVASGIPRLDYFASGGVVGCPALLVEPSAANSLLQSAAWNVSPWAATSGSQGATVSGNVTASPDGTTNADKLIEAAVTGTHFCLQTLTLTSGTTYTASCFVKASERTRGRLRMSGSGAYWDLEFNLTSGTVTGGTNPFIQNFGNGWYRIGATFTANQASNNFILFLLDASGNASYTGDGTSGLFVFGAQIEVGSVATSYIPTTTAPVTRNAEVISISGAVSGCVGQTEGTMYLEFIFRRPTIATAGPCGIASSNNQNRVLFWNNNSTNSMAVNIQVNAANIFNISVGTLIEGTRYKLAIGYKSGNSAIFLNGIQVGSTNTSAFTFAASLVAIFLGTYEAAAASVTNTGINAFTLYTTRLTNTELAALTA
jgi:hypothetical protein